MTPAPTRTPQDARFMKQSAAGTRETKRWDRAVSPPIEGRHYGVLITLFALAALPGWWFWSTGRVISLMIYGSMLLQPPLRQTTHVLVRRTRPSRIACYDPRPVCPPPSNACPGIDRRRAVIADCRAGRSTRGRPR